MAARAGRDQERLDVRRELRDEAAVLLGVLARLHVAAAAPRLVADAPVLHAERCGVAIRRALRGQTLRAGGRVAVRDPVVKLPWRARSDVGGEVGLGANQAAEVH